MSTTMYVWLVEPAPFELAWKDYQSEPPRRIPEAFHPRGSLKESEYSTPTIDQERSIEDDYFFSSPSVLMEFSGIIDSLTHQSYQTYKSRSRSNHFQAFRAFVYPFLICAPHATWNEFGGETGIVISPSTLRAVLRYRSLVDTTKLESDFESLGGCEPWKQREFKHFTSFERFSRYFDRFRVIAQEAIDANRMVYVGIF